MGGINDNMFFGNVPFYNGAATQSVRLEPEASPKLYYTPGQNATDGTKFTIAFWFKWATPDTGSSYYNLIYAEPSASTMFSFYQGKFYYGVNGTGGAQRYLHTAQVFRDSAAWYHVTVQYDRDNATEANKMKIFVNGLDVDDNGGYSTDQRGNIGGSDDPAWMKNGQLCGIGYRPSNNSQYFDGYLCDFHSIDGDVKAPTEFGEFKNGVFLPKLYSGSYGNNGFRLEFKNSTINATGSSSTLGADTSGNTIHWSTAGYVASDCNLPDSPENNFCTWNEQTNINAATLKRGNLNWSRNSGDQGHVAGTHAVTSGSWYFEFRNATANRFGVGLGDVNANNYATTNDLGYYDTQWAFLTNAKRIHANGGEVSYGVAVGEDEIGMCAYNLDTNDVWFGRQGTWFNTDGSSDSATVLAEIIAGTNTNAAFTNVSGRIAPFFCRQTSNGGAQVNFGLDSTFAGQVTAQNNTDANGEGDFYYTPPSGYLALCSRNLPEPAIGPNSATAASAHFNTIIYTGDGNDDREITGVGFQPDWVWIKSRSRSDVNHILTDSARGGDLPINSDGNYSESTQTNKVESFASDGFVFGQSVHSSVNANTSTYVAWNWKGNAGTESSSAAESSNNPATSVQTNATAGFSIIKYTGTGGAGTIAHGLGVTPNAIFIKNRDQADSWGVYYGDATDYMSFDTSNTTADDNTFWNDTAPTSSVFTVGTAHNVNADGEKYIAYVFAAIEGYSMMDTYEAAAEANGKMIYTGFRPQFAMMKNLDSAGSWIMFDRKRNGYNIDNHHVMGDTTAAESDDTDIDFHSCGIKCRRSSTSFNSAHTFFIMAFAETPFKYANAVM